MVISLEMKETEMGDRGSKSDWMSVKEQRVDGFSVIDLYVYNCKVYSSRRETGYWDKFSNSILKLPL